MLFNFTLDPIDEIAPWGEPPKLSLSWYGLTLGEYYLQTGSDQLLRYSEAVIERDCENAPGAKVRTFLDYQVERFREDVFDIVPRVLEEVPPDLARYASHTEGQVWLTRCKDWFERQEPTEARLDRWDKAATWLHQRSLDTGYLTVTAKIWFWRSGNTIHIEWDNRSQEFDGLPMWSARLGSFALTVDEFMDELRDFHARFIQAMQARVDEICRSWSRTDIRVDLDELRKTQQHWDCPIERLILHWEPTDWSAVRAAVPEIESSSRV